MSNSNASLRWMVSLGFWFLMVGNVTNCKSQELLGAFTHVLVHNPDESLDQYRDEAAEWLPDVEKLSKNNEHDGSPETIVCLGSSSFRIWDSIDRDMAPYRMVRRAYGGSKYSDVAIHAEALIANLEFQAAAIYVGNDIRGEPDDKTPEEIAKLASKVIETIRKERPEAKVFVIAITPTPSRFAQWELTRQANLALENVVKQTPNTYFIRTEQSYLNAEGQPREELFQTDRLHQSEDGYAIWSSILKKKFEEAGVKVSK